jgi:hypothetical protein
MKRQRGITCAMSVRTSAKSNSHRKTRCVEPCGTGRKIIHLTRGGLRCESIGGVSSGHSSEETGGNIRGAKGQRTKRKQSVNHLAKLWCEGGRNRESVATAAATHPAARSGKGGFPDQLKSRPDESQKAAKGDVR